MKICANRSIEDSQRLLNACLNCATQGLRVVYGRKFQWIKTRYTSALGLATALLYSTQVRLLAGSWDLLSGINSLNSAIRPALAAGRMAVLFGADSENIVSNYAEICREYGQYAEGESILEQFLTRSESVRAKCLLREINSDRINNTPPLWSANDVTTVQVNEFLTENMFDAALGVLKGKRGINVRLARARVYSAMEDADLTMNEWRSIEKSNARQIPTSPSDWFFLSDGVADEPAFWRLMLTLAPRLHGAFPLHEEIAQMHQLSLTDRLILMCRYNIARTSKDAALMKELSVQYPAWKEAHRWSQLLQT